MLIAQLTGQRKAQPARGRASFPSDKYAIPNRRMAGSVVPMPLAWETPIRMGNLRDPDGPQVTFASESFIDELAAAAKADPVAFRLALLERGTGDDAGFKRARSIACLKAAAEKFGWDAAPVTARRASRGDVVTGRGVAYAYRSETVGGRDRRSRSQSPHRPHLGQAHRLRARLRARHQSRSADAHARRRPAALGEPRAASKRSRFDEAKMLSVDWVSSPTLTHADVPGAHRHHPGERRSATRIGRTCAHYGAGETVCKPMLAAVANAVFDATGVRMRRVPLTPARVLAALKA